MDNLISYILQVATILITLILGVFTAIQTGKLQKGQNVVSITTSYRKQRSEQLKEYGSMIVANSQPSLLDKSKELALEMTVNVHNAAAVFAMILHRSFEQDLELINLAERIGEIQDRYFENVYCVDSCDEETLELLERQLIAYRKIFIIKCDVYTYTEWQRIKKETSGVTTYSIEWMEFYEKLQCKYENELRETIEQYEDVLVEYDAANGEV